MRRCVSSSRAGRAALIAALAIASACWVRGPLVCESTATCGPDLAIGDGGGLDLRSTDLTPTECPAVNPPAASDQCPGARPICDQNGACRFCRAHAECASSVCRPDGSCASAAQVAYVEGKETCPGADGTAAKPYCELATALQNLGGRVVVRVRGAAWAHGPVSVAAPVEILGPDDPGELAAVVQGGDQPAIAVGVAAGDVVISGLRLGGTSSDQPNLHCTGGGAAMHLSLSRLVLADAAGFGIESNGCTISATSLTVVGNGAGGIYAAGAALSLESSLVTGNLGPGVEVDTTASVTLRFLTIAANQAPGSAARAGAVHNHQPGTITIDASILWANSLLGDTPLYGTDGTNLVTNLALPGATVGAPDFRSSTDFHLDGRTANNTTCCLDKRDTGPARDVDYQVRPLGTKLDIGADEVP